MLHSAADWGVSDPFSVPLVAREMRRSGEFSISDIEKVTFYDTYKFFRPFFKFTRRV
jgi:predicted metal-dependent TIM-barrel fold hydrolase